MAEIASKEEFTLLRQALGNPQMNFHSTTVDENGHGRENPVGIETRVSILELDVLEHAGFIA